MLSTRLAPDRLASSLLTADAWQPCPTIADRAFWEGQPEPLRAAWIEAAVADAAEPWPPLPAHRFLDFARDGNRTRYQDLHFARRSRLARLAVAECAENRGRFVDAIVDGIWALCEESFWGVPAHNWGPNGHLPLPDVTAPVVDLFAAETGALLAWVDRLLHDRLTAVTPLIPARIRLEVERRILAPCREREFGWMGFHGNPVNNWNPWINSNWLVCLLLLETDPQRRLADLQRILRSLDCFLAHYPADGGCDEGPGYWGRAGASLFDCLWTLRAATAGAFDVFAEPLIREMGRYIYRLHIDGDWFVNFADASAIGHPEGLLVYRFGEAIADAPMRRFGAWLTQRAGSGPALGRIASLGRFLPDLAVRSRALAEADAAPPLPADVWLPGIQVMVARDRAASPAGFFLAAKGGHNAESHNHNDIGHFVAYLDGRPVLVDAGVETYSRKTFSAERYDLWTMQSSYHNLPTINGCQQSPGREFAARKVDYQADPKRARLALDLVPAWPAAAGVRRWCRTVELIRGEAIEIADIWELADVREPLRLHLLTPCSVEAEAPGTIRLLPATVAHDRPTGAARLAYDPAWELTVESIAIEDPQLANVWGDRLYRLTLALPETKPQGTHRLRLTR